MYVHWTLFLDQFPNFNNILWPFYGLCSVRILGKVPEFIYAMILEISRNIAFLPQKGSNVQALWICSTCIRKIFQNPTMFVTDDAWQVGPLQLWNELNFENISVSNLFYFFKPCSTECFLKQMSSYTYI